MTAPRAAWSVAGAIAGLAGLAASQGAAALLERRSSPVVGVAEAVIELAPGTLVEGAIENLGSRDKPILIVGILVAVTALAAVSGSLARTRPVVAVSIIVATTVIGMLAVMTRRDAGLVDLVPAVVGALVWHLALRFLTEPLETGSLEPGPLEPGYDGSQPGERDATPVDGHTRRGFVQRSVVTAALAAGVGWFGKAWGRGRREVEEIRVALKPTLPVTQPVLPSGVSVDATGMPQWQTPNQDFYLIHTALSAPTINPDQWSLRIHGMVANEREISFQDLLDARLTERWVTLNCVSNPIGGPLIGNAWWSGVLIADLLAEAGVDPNADAVLQTSHDGWTCGTPLEALTDPDRQALLAIAMNGEPLPIDHGFPVRTIVPGLYGYVSATKWVVDLEVTRFDRFEAYWTGKGWSERGPVKISSRIDVPRNGKETPAGSVTIGGHAWSQHTGISGVQVAVDGDDWIDVTLATVPNRDTWVQWRTEVDLASGSHLVRVRAIGADGTVQTGARAGVVPDGATGWHEIGFTAT